ncbi:hypothetical protein AB6A40_006271 [Gnathostoma spinigerum]|uniref:Uncharacterized protein n=1 Tax=Gnathostoma spinigerum TaxID=75299 RepID=A0ABD6ESB1_9BILA
MPQAKGWVFSATVLAVVMCQFSVIALEEDLDIVQIYEPQKSDLSINNTVLMVSPGFKRIPGIMKERKEVVVKSAAPQIDIEKGILPKSVKDWSSGRKDERLSKKTGRKEKKEKPRKAGGPRMKRHATRGERSAARELRHTAGSEEKKHHYAVDGELRITKLI